VMFWLKFGRVTRAQEAEKLLDVSVCKPGGLTELTAGTSPGNGPNFGKSNFVAKILTLTHPNSSSKAFADSCMSSKSIDRSCRLLHQNGFSTQYCIDLIC
jgi:predicted fused transcriptional regulator/phosphomethylpyrimidine kinase